jgi:hypothetical protein
MAKDGDVTTLAMEGSLLDRPLVERLDRAIKTHGKSSPRLVVDCSTVHDATPEGLCALIELGSRLSGVWQVVLAALPRAFLRHAIEVGLAERFAIYASVAAAQRALTDLEG